GIRDFHVTRVQTCALPIFKLNGQKMWITNAGFADLFIVFAKVDEDTELSAFLVEKEFGGITMNPEERKMGIKGSSTRQVFFNDCPVPAENLLFDRDRKSVV